MTDPAVLLTRARALEETGDFRGLVELLERLDPGPLLDEPELRYRLAYGLRRVGRSRPALDLVVALEPSVQRRGDDRLVRRRLSLEAMLRYDLGEVAAAEALWERLAATSAEAGDHTLAAAASNNLGVVRTLQDRTQEALTAYNRALLASRRLGDRRGIAQAHQNLAILYRELELGRESAAHFRDAHAHARAAGSEDIMGRADEERALLFLAEGDEPLACVSAQRALERLAAIDDATGMGEALRVLGIAALRRRDAERARADLAQAHGRGVDTGNVLLQAETLEALAVLELLEGREAQAASRRAEASTLFEAMGATAWGRRIRARTVQLAAL